jgi:hypothetical protein
VPKICVVMSKSFLVKSTPQIVKIIDSVLDINGCGDRSKLMHQLLLPHILDVIVSDNSEINDVESASKEITNIFHTYYDSI